MKDTVVDQAGQSFLMKDHLELRLKRWEILNRTIYIYT